MVVYCAFQFSVVACCFSLDCLFRLGVLRGVGMMVLTLRVVVV